MILTTLLYILGFIATLASTFYLTKKNGYSDDLQLILPLLVGITIILIDLLWRTRMHQKTIAETDNILAGLSRNDRIAFTVFFKKLHRCSQSQGFGAQLLIKKVYASLQSMVTKCDSDSDFFFPDIVGANQILLQHLDRRDEFRGVSMLTKVADWEHHEKWGSYLDANILMAKKGVRITRILVVRSSDVITGMQDVAKQLYDAGVILRCIDEKFIIAHGYYCDITIFPNRELGLYVPMNRADPKLVVTQSPEMLRKLEFQYSRILKNSYEFPLHSSTTSQNATPMLADAMKATAA